MNFLKRLVSERIFDRLSSMGRKPYRFLLFDLPSSHEIERDLVTEASLIQTILSNRRNETSKRPGGDCKRVKIATVESLNRVPTEPYDPRIVHISGHGHPEGMEVLGKVIPWADIALGLKKWVAPLPELPLQRSRCKRTLVFSCCHSHGAIRKLQPFMKQYFSGMYFLNPQKPSFEDTLVAWSMFYREVNPLYPHGDDQRTEALLSRINHFFGEEPIISFTSIER